MALTRTLGQLRDSVRRAADVVAFTDRHSDASVNDLINRALGALQRVTAIVDPEFRPLASTTITTDGTATLYGLPTDCRSLISVEYTAEGEKTWLIPFEMHERAYFTDAPNNSNATRAHHYRRIGDNIEFLPRPVADHTALIWYATTATQLTSDSDTVDVFDRLDDYVIWWAAREITLDRGDFDRHDRLGQKIGEMVADIQVLARSRDLSAPSRIVDVRQADRYGRNRWG